MSAEQALLVPESATDRMVCDMVLFGTEDVRKRLSAIKYSEASDAEKAEAERDLVAVLEATRIVALILWPVVPSMSVRILEQLRIDGDASSRTPNWDDVRWGGLKSGHELSANPRPVFMRIEATMAEAI